MIEGEERQTFEDDGYCVERYLIPAEMIASARNRVLEMIDEPPEWAARSWQVIDPARKLNSKGEPLPLGIQRPGRFEPVFDSVARHPISSPL